MNLMINDDYQYTNHEGVLTIFTDTFSSWSKGLLSLVLDTDLRPPLLIEVFDVQENEDLQVRIRKTCKFRSISNLTTRWQNDRLKLKTGDWLIDC